MFSGANKEYFENDEYVLSDEEKAMLNAGSVLGKEGWGVKKTARKLLDLEAADFIASDTHDLDERACHMEECFELVSRKYGEKTARRLFQENAQQILNSRK